ncbi:PST-A protein [Plasmodium cynomolgi strain B]|uniref:PST-A protein n=1 Tax=Plasmodium cynomolgi (strain B) TaxID=1120755 RepID=K6UXZ3_PLACD|nr:PST-A protein [Plasmodium cynomolgi strain B]GAB68679.1 PST-A protein [Plasmodium cynomolgi strain B]
MDGYIYYDEDIITPTTTRLDGKPKLGAFFNKDGLLMRTYGWLVRNAIGIIVLIHGLNSHARLTFLRHNVEIVDNSKAILKDENNYYVYENSWVEHFNNNGYSVYALDLQGHGLSDGMISFQKIASPRSYKYKYFYLPLISGFFPTSRFVTKIGFQKYPYLNDLDKIRSKNGITLKYWHELLKATSNLEHDMEYIPNDIPILLIHSKDDIFCYYKGVLSFFNRLMNDNKELITLENMEHGLTTEPGNEMALENIIDWIAKLDTKKEMAEPLEVN